MPEKATKFTQISLNFLYLDFVGALKRIDRERSYGIVHLIGLDTRRDVAWRNLINNKTIARDYFRNETRPAYLKGSSS